MSNSFLVLYLPIVHILAGELFARGLPPGPAVQLSADLPISGGGGRGGILSKSGGKSMKEDLSSAGETAHNGTMVQ
jgi:hypothetical protein